MDVRFGRDTGEICRMIISDPRFAAQIRGGPGNRAYKFDDIGTAIVFLDRRGWKDDPEVKIWVMDVDTGKTWLDARKVHYRTGMHSPMNFGFGAVTEKQPGTIDFQAMKKAALAQGERAYGDRQTLAAPVK